MKRLIVIVGPNAVGKTTTAKCLVDKLPKTAYVDSDWCRFMNPFRFTGLQNKLRPRICMIYCVTILYAKR